MKSDVKFVVDRDTYVFMFDCSVMDVATTLASSVVGDTMKRAILG
jgi:hypothetical protein